jgi:hypothetical protein
MDGGQGRRDGGWDRELGRRMEHQVVLGHLAPRYQAAAEWREEVRAWGAAAGTGDGEPGVVRRLFGGALARLGRRRRPAAGRAEPFVRCAG